MEKALIIPYGEKNLVESTTRTNTAAWIDFAQDPIVTKLEVSATFMRPPPDRHTPIFRLSITPNTQ
jgi:hypothetical protein